MNQVAKLVIIDADERYLMLHRDNHPAYGDDPDLPGGTIEEGELPLETMIREAYEEAQVIIREDQAVQVYDGIDRSTQKTHHTLYMARLNKRPIIILSWEHSSYEWLDREDFLEKAKSANDSYMHMVYTALIRI